MVLETDLGKNWLAFDGEWVPTRTISDESYLITFALQGEITVTIDGEDFSVDLVAGTMSTSGHSVPIAIPASNDWASVQIRATPTHTWIAVKSQMTTNDYGSSTAPPTGHVLLVDRVADPSGDFSIDGDGRFHRFSVQSTNVIYPESCEYSPSPIEECLFDEDFPISHQIYTAGFDVDDAINDKRILTQDINGNPFSSPKEFNWQVIDHVGGNELESNGDDADFTSRSEVGGEYRESARVSTYLGVGQYASVLYYEAGDGLASTIAFFPYRSFSTAPPHARYQSACEVITPTNSQSALNPFKVTGTLIGYVNEKYYDRVYTDSSYTTIDTETLTSERNIELFGGTQTVEFYFYLPDHSCGDPYPKPRFRVEMIGITLDEVCNVAASSGTIDNSTAEWSF